MVIWVQNARAQPANAADRSTKWKKTSNQHEKELHCAYTKG